MIYKLVTFKLSLINRVRLLLLDDLNVNLNKKAKNREISCTSFLVFYLRYRPEFICLNIVMGPGRANTFHVRKTFKRAKLNAGKPKISSQKFV